MHEEYRAVFVAGPAARLERGFCQSRQGPGTPRGTFSPAAAGLVARFRPRCPKTG